MSIGKAQSYEDEFPNNNVICFKYLQQRYSLFTWGKRRSLDRSDPLGLGPQKTSPQCRR